MRNRTLAVLGAGLLAASLVLGTLSQALAQAPGWGGWGPAGMMGGAGAGRGPMGGGFGPGGMMGGSGPGGMMSSGMMGPGMIGGSWPGAAGAPLGSLDDARGAFQAYLDRAANPDLALGEVMEFERNFYAMVVEKSAGRGAFELLADRASGAVFPEPGPNMMWNTTYGHMAGRGGMMGGWSAPAATGRPAVTPEQARASAQGWLDRYQPGSTTEAPDAFPGYYTLHTLADGKITGMLSVNAYTGQVWYHAWHGAFVASTEGAH